MSSLHDRTFYYATIKAYDGIKYMACNKPGTDRLTWFHSECIFEPFECATAIDAYKIAMVALKECPKEVATELDIHSIRVHFVTIKVTIEETGVTENAA